MDRYVRDVMTTRVVTVREWTPFKAVARLLAEHRISAVPVVDGIGRPVGIVSEADLLPKEFGADRADRAGRPRGKRQRHEQAQADATIARELMTEPAVTVRSNQTLVEAARIMHDRDIKRLPVVGDFGIMVGIVSRRDLLSVFLRSDEAIRREIVEDVIQRTLWLPSTLMDVSVVEGVVTLRGSLEHKDLCDLVAALVRRIAGVVDVRDQLTWAGERDSSHDDLTAVMVPGMLV